MTAVCSIHHSKKAVSRSSLWWARGRCAAGLRPRREPLSSCSRLLHSFNEVHRHAPVQFSRGGPVADALLHMLQSAACLRSPGPPSQAPLWPRSDWAAGRMNGRFRQSLLACWHRSWLAATPSREWSLRPHGEQVVPAFETAIEGLEVGGTKKVRSEPEQCYGAWSEDKVISVPKPDVRFH